MEQPTASEIYEQYYVGDRFTLSGFGMDGKYEVVDRTPLENAIRLEIVKVDPCR